MNRIGLTYFSKTLSAALQLVCFFGVFATAFAEKMETQIQGVGDRNLVYTTPYTIDGDDVTFTARVYRNGNLVTTEYPEEWFTWLRRTEDGDELLGIGYTLQTQKSLMGIGGGVIIGRFETYDDSALVLPNDGGKYLILPDDKRLTVYKTAS